MAIISSSPKLKSYANLAKMLAWLVVLFYSFKAVVEFLSIIVDPKYQSAVVRGDWRAWLETPTYLGGILLQGLVSWLLLMGLSIGLAILSEVSYSQQKSNDNSVPQYYQPKRVIWVSKWLERMAIIGAAAKTLILISPLLQLRETVFSLRLSNGLSWGLWLGTSIALLILECGLIYFSLKGFAEILRVIMEIESHTRR